MRVSYIFLFHTKPALPTLRLLLLGFILFSDSCIVKKSVYTEICNLHVKFQYNMHTLVLILTCVST